MLALLLIVLVSTQVLTGQCFTDSECVEDISIVYWFSTLYFEHVQYPLKNAYSLISSTNFNPNYTSIFMLHGYRETAFTGSAQTLVKAYLELNERGNLSNVLAFNYGSLVKYDYLDALNNASCISVAIAEFFEALTPKFQAIDNIQLVGHSLGSQIIANVTLTYGPRFPFVIGCDPAGPGYDGYSRPHLDKNKATFVTCINTDRSYLGTSRIDCTVNILPNFGARPQPGCDLISGCSHQRCYEYLAEALLNNTFIAAKCTKSSYLFYTAYSCDATALINMGNLDRSAIGSYYCKTNASPLYGRGKNGIQTSTKVIG